MIFFDRQFQRVPPGYGYRENGRGPMLPCTEEEFASFRPIAARRFIMAFFLFFFSVNGTPSQPVATDMRPVCYDG